MLFLSVACITIYTDDIAMLIISEADIAATKLAGNTILAILNKWFCSDLLILKYRENEVYDVSC